MHLFINKVYLIPVLRFSFHLKQSDSLVILLKSNTICLFKDINILCIFTVFAKLLNGLGYGSIVIAFLHLLLWG